MIFAYIMIAGGLGRCAGEVVELVSGGPTPISITLTAAALVLLALGFLGLWRDCRDNVLGRSAVILIALGAMGFAGVVVWALSMEAPTIAVISRTVPFILAGVLTFFGAIALSAWLAISGAYPPWIGYGLGVSILLSLIVSYVPFSSAVQPLIDVLLALAFIQLGLSMAEKRRSERRKR